MRLSYSHNQNSRSSEFVCLKRGKHLLTGGHMFHQLRDGNIVPFIIAYNSIIFCFGIALIGSFTCSISFVFILLDRPFYVQRVLITFEILFKEIFIDNLDDSTNSSNFSHFVTLTSREKDQNHLYLDTSSWNKHMNPNRS